MSDTSLADLLQVFIAGGALGGGTWWLVDDVPTLAQRADNAGRGAILGSLSGSYVAFIYWLVFGVAGRVA